MQILYLFCVLISYRKKAHNHSCHSLLDQPSLCRRFVVIKDYLHSMLIWWRHTVKDRHHLVMHTLITRMVPFVCFMFIWFSSETTNAATPQYVNITMLKALNRQGKALCSLATTWKTQLGIMSTTTNPWNASLASCSVQKSSIPPVWCGYSGISCSPSTFLVTNLSLSSQSLLGTIPKSIGGLNASLQYLDFSYNSLTGSLPSEFASLSAHLTILNLAGNNFTQHALLPLSKLNRLQWLDISSNGLTGTIPTLLSTLTSLVELNLAFSTLHGTVPTFLILLTNLQFLDMSLNVLSGTIPTNVLSGWPGMTMLNVQGNSLVGSLPSSIGSLRQLQGLYLGNNGFVGSLPSTLSALSALTCLHLEQNRFVGHLSKSTTSPWTMLQELRLDGNMLSGTLLNDLFASMANSLSVLNLEMNAFSGSLVFLDLLLHPGVFVFLFFLTHQVLGLFSSIVCFFVDLSGFGCMQAPFPRHCRRWCR